MHRSHLYSCSTNYRWFLHPVSNLQFLFYCYSSDFITFLWCCCYYIIFYLYFSCIIFAELSEVSTFAVTEYGTDFSLSVIVPNSIFLFYLIFCDSFLFTGITVICTFIHICWLNFNRILIIRI